MTEFEKLLIELESEYLTDLHSDKGLPFSNTKSNAVEGFIDSHQIISELITVTLLKNDESIIEKAKKLTIASRRYFAECYLKDQHFNADFKNNLVETFGELK